MGHPSDSPGCHARWGEVHQVPRRLDAIGRLVSQRPVLLVVLALLALLLLAQIAMWLATGRQSVRAALFGALVDEYLVNLREGWPPDDRPSYLYVCPDLFEDLPKSDVERRGEMLESLGIGLISVDDLGPEGGLPRPEAKASSICVDVALNSPLVAISVISHGYGPFPVTGSAVKQVDLFVLGRWIRVGRYGHDRAVW